MTSVAPTRLVTARRVIVKIGSALLVDAATGELRREWLAGVADDLAAMRARGAKSGDKVAIYMRNRPEYPQGLAACFKARLVPVNVNYLKI